jgi:hypothetical protein
MLSKDFTQEKHLEQMIGRLNHVATLMEMLRHFLGRLYTALYRAKKKGKTKLENPEKEDLKLFQYFITMPQIKVSQ